MVLTEVRAGKTYQIHDVRDTTGQRRHLESMGFVPGEFIKVISRMHGSIIVNVKGSRVALGPDLTNSILV